MHQVVQCFATYGSPQSECAGRTDPHGQFPFLTCYGCLFGNVQADLKIFWTAKRRKKDAFSLNLKTLVPSNPLSRWGSRPVPLQAEASNFNYPYPQ